MPACPKKRPPLLWLFSLLVVILLGLAACRIGAGEVELSASVSYEVHLGYPGPAYWGMAGSGAPLKVTVAP